MLGLASQSDGNSERNGFPRNLECGDHLRRPRYRSEGQSDVGLTEAGCAIFTRSLPEREMFTTLVGQRIMA